MANNKFDQLVEDLNTGKLSLTMIQIAIRAYIKERKDIPDGVKDLIAGSDQREGIIYPLFKVIQNTIGIMELAYRRGCNEENTNLETIDFLKQQNADLAKSIEKLKKRRQT